MKFGMQVGLGPGDFVLDGDPAPPPQKGDGALQIFGPCLLWPNGWMDEAGNWQGRRPQPRRLCVRWGPSPFHQKVAEPLGMEVGLSPGEFVLDGDPAPLPKRGAEHPLQF